MLSPSAVATASPKSKWGLVKPEACKYPCPPQAYFINSPNYSPYHVDMALKPEHTPWRSANNLKAYSEVPDYFISVLYSSYKPYNVFCRKCNDQHVAMHGIILYCYIWYLIIYISGPLVPSSPSNYLLLNEYLVAMVAYFAK